MNSQDSQTEDTTSPGTTASTTANPDIEAKLNPPPTKGAAKKNLIERLRSKFQASSHAGGKGTGGEGNGNAAPPHQETPTATKKKLFGWKNTGIPNASGIFKKRAAYGFESAWLHLSAPKIRKKFIEKFSENLGLIGTPVGTEGEQILQRFIAANHVSAAWYNGKVRRQKTLQVTYFIFSVSLLIAVPVLIYVGPELTGKIKFLNPTSSLKNVTDIGTRLTVLLAGLFAVHRAINGWVSQRNRIGPYWSARAKLVDVIYTIETNWGGRKKEAKVENGSLSADFRRDLLAGIEQGRKIVRDETEAFFTSYTLPTVSLGESLKGALTEAQSAVGGFQSAATRARAKQQEAVVSTNEKLRALRGEITGLMQVVDRLDEQSKTIDTEIQNAASAEVKDLLKAKLQSLQKEEAKYRGQLDAKTIEVEILKSD